MINSCRKCNLRWFEGVVCRKMNCQKEHTALIWAVIRSHNCGLPMKHIIPNWTCRTLCWRVTGQITKFLVDPFERHRGAAGPVCFARGGGVGSGRGWRRSVARSLARSCRPHAGARRVWSCCNFSIQFFMAPDIRNGRKCYFPDQDTSSGA